MCEPEPHWFHVGEKSAPGSSDSDNMKHTVTLNKIQDWIWDTVGTHLNKS